ncbi:MAG: RNA methyltransferase [Lentisphaerae bacterium]|nr:RNA methyltransferase [Lentisphaerota bacterium]
MKTVGSEARAWQLALERLQTIEVVWADPAARQRELLACSHWLADQTAYPRLARLSTLLKPDLSLETFISVLVPVEREVARRRVTDVQILARDRAPPAAAAAAMPLTVVVDSLRSAFNSGGLFRTADCFGAAAVWLCGYTATPDHPHVAEAALGAARHVPWRHWTRLAEAVAELRCASVAVIALETVADAQPIESYTWPFPCALLLGSERFGLGPDIIHQADDVVRIPVYGAKNSLNVVSAAAIALHAARTAWERARA